MASRGCVARVLATVATLASTAAAGADRAEPILSRHVPAELLALTARLKAEHPPQPADSLAGGLVLHEQVLVDTQSGRQDIVRNQLVLVLDPGRPGAGRIELPSPEGFSVQRAEGWTVHADGRFDRLGKRGARTGAASTGRPGAVVFQFPASRAGDVLGVSLALSAPFPLRFSELLLSGPLRVAAAEVELRNDAVTAFQATAANVRERKFSAEVMQRHDGNATASVLRFQDLAVAAHGDWLCPPQAREPLARIGHYGTYHPRFREWYRNNSWAMAALELDALVGRAQLRQGDVRGRATALVRGLSDDNQKAAALGRYVRDALVDVSFGESGGQLRDVETLLRAQEANAWEKGILLAALMRAIQLPVEVAWVRDGSRGPLVEQDPSPWQFTDIIVHAVWDPSLWYAPAHPLCPPGSLPASLLGAPAFSLPADLAAQHERLALEVFGMRGEAPAFLEQYYRQDPGSLLRHQPITESFPSYLVGQYLYRLETQRWFQLGTLPTDRSPPLGTLAETVLLDPLGGQLQLRLRGHGLNPFSLLIRTGGGLTPAMQSYVEQRFPGMLVLAADPLTGGALDSTAWTARLGARAVPPPAADTWILPPELVFGRPFLDGWSERPRGCFHAEGGFELARATEVPLPAGWQGFVPLPAYQFDWGPLSYRAEVQGRDGRAVLLRRLRVEACTVEGAELRAVQEVARRIADYERVPVSLVRAGASPGR